MEKWRNFVTAQHLQSYWKILHAELLECIHNGLPVYQQTGFPIETEDLLPEKKLGKIKGELALRDAKRKEANKRTITLADIPSSFSPRDFTGYFSPPSTIATIETSNFDSEAKRIFENLRKRKNLEVIDNINIFLFKREDVNQFAQDHGYPMIDDQTGFGKSGTNEGTEVTETGPEKAQAKPNALASSQPVNFLHKECGDIWHIGFEGKKIRVNPLDGFLYIAEILRQKQGVSVSCVALRQVVPGRVRKNVMPEGAVMDEGLYSDHGKQAINTPKTKVEYLKRYQQLRNKLSEIEDLQEHERPPDANFEKKEIEEEMSKIELALKEKTFNEPNAKKAQINVSSRIKDAYNVIQKAGMKELAKHLEKNIKPDGAFGLRYLGTLSWDVVIK